MLMKRNDWDTVYSQKEMAQYPDNMLVRFIARNYYNAPDRKDVKFLDVGCGVGASTWYLAREGFSVAAIDGSIIAIERLKNRLEKENLDAFMMCVDITQLEFKEDYFDGIVDVSSTCYVPQDKIEGLMQKLYKVLKPGGKFFSITPTHLCSKPPFDNTVEGVELNARFQDYDTAKNNFKDFKNVQLNLYTYETGKADDWNQISLWSIEATK